MSRDQSNAPATTQPPRQPDLERHIQQIVDSEEGGFQLLRRPPGSTAPPGAPQQRQGVRRQRQAPSALPAALQHRTCFAGRPGRAVNPARRLRNGLLVLLHPARGRPQRVLAAMLQAIPADIEGLAP